MLVVIGTDCIGSYKSNYYAIKTAPGVCWFCIANIAWMNGMFL